LFVEWHDLDLLALDTALGIHFVNEELERSSGRLRPMLAPPPGQRVDIGDFERLLCPIATLPSIRQW